MKSDNSLRVPSFNQAMAGVLSRAGVDKTSVVRLMGPGGLAPLLWFCRHGFEKVGYVRPGPCPAEACDLLIVMDDGGVDTLAHCLENGPHLRDGGVLIVQTPQTGPAGGPHSVRRLLAQFGYRVEQSVHGHHRNLHLARRGGAGGLQKAA